MCGLPTTYQSLRLTNKKETNRKHKGTGFIEGGGGCGIKHSHDKVPYSRKIKVQTAGKTDLHAFQINTTVSFPVKCYKRALGKPWTKIIKINNFKNLTNMKVH